MPSCVSVQNRDFLVLEHNDITGFVTALGKAGVVHNWRATEVGKYMTEIGTPKRGRLTNILCAERYDLRCP